MASLNTTSTSMVGLFDLEQNFQPKPFREWTQANWHTSIPIAIAYLLLVYFGRKFMEKRERFELRSSLILWSLALAVFSILGTVRIAPIFYDTLTTKGFRFSVCDPEFYEKKVTSFWAMVFALSKAVELGDTAFIVLRKQNLIFLHWYHHASVLVYAWYQHSVYNSAGRWYFNMNYFVHAFMYSYFTARALRFKVPMWVNVVITTMQIVQMAVGLLLVGYVGYVRYIIGDKCHLTDIAVLSTVLLYLSYFVLFVKFYQDTYGKKKPPPAKKTD